MSSERIKVNGPLGNAGGSREGRFSQLVAFLLPLVVLCPVSKRCRYGSVGSRLVVLVEQLQSGG